MSDYTEQARAAAKACVDQLFVSGSGARADRLVLWCDAAKRDLGGWSRGPVEDHVAAAIERAVEAHEDACVERVIAALEPDIEHARDPVRKAAFAFAMQTAVSAIRARGQKP